MRASSDCTRKRWHLSRFADRKKRRASALRWIAFKVTDPDRAAVFLFSLHGMRYRVLVEKPGNCPFERAKDVFPPPDLWLSDRCLYYALLDAAADAWCALSGQTEFRLHERRAAA